MQGRHRGALPELHGVDQRAASSARMMKAFEAMDNIADLAMEYDAIARSHERAARAAEEAARLYRDASHKAMQRAREIERRLVDVTRILRVAALQELRDRIGVVDGR